MAVPPKFAGTKVEFAAASVAESQPTSKHTMEVYLDYCCPFSAKMFRNLESEVFPAIKKNPGWAPKLTFVFRQQAQPWHPSSILMHEAAIAVQQLQPDKFFLYSHLLFEEQKSYFDVNVVNETRNQTYKRLAKLAAKVGLDEGQVYDLLEISDKPGPDGSLNSGNKVTNDFKLTVRMNRLVGVHVTPTVVFNGIVQDVSSGWDLTQWKDWLMTNVI